MAGSTSLPLLLPLAILFLTLYITPAAAFGAGNIASISKIEGSNWRHGDIEDTLLQLMMAAAASRGGRPKKFDNMTVKRVYFGNWLRDYSQAVDVGSLKAVEAGTIRVLVWVLGFMTFGYATGEFEVTAERLGCYRPEEHIDNPKDYADNLDARDYDPRLRGPVDEATELAIDPQTGLKNYIANERIRSLSSGDPMNTSAGLVRRLFTRCIELGRSYARSGDHRELYEALRILGTGLHCLEDFSAHSNYTELALVELGETEIFPHVGSSTQVHVQGRTVWPIVTGTFGGVDFLHSVLGEASDKMIQSEIEQLESTINSAEQQARKDGGEQSIIKDLLSKLPIGGGDDFQNQASELENKSKAKASEGRSRQYGIGASGENLTREIYPFLEFHDKIMKAINEALDKIPGLMALIEKLSEAISVFVFSLLAPFILPIVAQAKIELAEGSSEVIGSSVDKQFIVFNNPRSSDPTHSMLSKDHFTNRLNEPAGKVASEVIKFVVPMLMQAWDDESISIPRLMDEIIGAVFHHPAFRDGSDGRPGREGRQRMFNVVRGWWEEKDESERDLLRYSLSREGVREGRNHKEGNDSGHGCCKPLKRKKPKKDGGEFSGIGENVGKAIEEALSGGKGGGGGGGSGFGGLVGGLAGAALGGALAGGLLETLENDGRRVRSDFETLENDGRQTRNEIDNYATRSYDNAEGSARTYERDVYGAVAGGGAYAAGRREESYAPSGGSYSYAPSDSYGGQQTYASSGSYAKQESSSYRSRDTYESTYTTTTTSSSVGGYPAQRTEYSISEETPYTGYTERTREYVAPLSSRGYEPPPPIIRQESFATDPAGGRDGYGSTVRRRYEDGNEIVETTAYRRPDDDDDYPQARGGMRRQETFEERKWRKGSDDEEEEEVEVEVDYRRYRKNDDDDDDDGRDKWRRKSEDEVYESGSD